MDRVTSCSSQQQIVLKGLELFLHGGWLNAVGGGEVEDSRGVAGQRFGLPPGEP